METVYQKIVTGQSVTSGTPSCVSIDFPTRVFITAVIVKQTSGTLEGFTVTVYSRSEGCTDQNPIYEVVPEQTVATSNSTMRHRDNQGYPFENKDTTYGQKIYVRISASGTGAKNFDITLVCRQHHS